MTEPIWKLPMADRRNQRFREKVRASRAVAWGWPHQCRCGTMEVRAYRNRAYCARCGNAIRGCVYRGQGRPCTCLLPDPRQTPYGKPARVPPGCVVS